ncbi:MAG: TspO/MBR family protein [Chloroherpetonaceae bacterium]|nr:tryptophan-rich sensory protein [Chloroherpetonaceae bacterium]MCS7212380.1 tryptophan-rich sensory protein [Chloroherpetonaceae bacterium]MDW8018583.1 TspO/MBR family protein [Chloroherpetonaceae bacterium]MDW8467314.1 TspO/MBR family protein [Chloroherpetonaceae bacterium]
MNKIYTFWSKLRWYHGVLFFFVMNLLSGGWIATRSYLDAVGRPPFMPPDWAFAPIWVVLQALMVWAGFLLVQKMRTEPQYTVLFWSYTSLWGFFSMFSWLYFGLHSPILGFLTTLGMFATNALNLYFGFQARDKRYALLLLPLMIWLTLALSVAGWQFLYTPDELFCTQPFAVR